MRQTQLRNIYCAESYQSIYGELSVLKELQEHEHGHI